MKTILVFFFLLLSSIIGRSQSLPMIMDMVHNNPGEPPFVTKYNDPEYLKSQGFTATVPHWHINCLINYDNFKKKCIPVKSETRKWMDAKAQEVSVKLDACEKAGIEVYPFTDFLVFPTEIWRKFGDSIERVEKDAPHTVMGAKGETRLPDMQRKFTQRLVRAQVEGIFERFPQLDGLVVRFGETYLFDTPFHSGGSPIRKGKDGLKDHLTLLNILRDEICVKRNKKLIYRTWDFGFNFHTNPEYYLAVTDAIEPHANLFFSIKYQQDDFLRMTPFNPTIGIGKHQQIVEAQSRMEAYGKAAHPYYSAFGVINGWPETKYEIKDGHFTGRLNDPLHPRGLRDVVNRNKVKGVMTWSHGGGWQGPYITNEIWTDLNTYVVSHWAQNTSRTEEELFYEFATLKNITGMQADWFRQIAILSIEGVRKGQLNSFTGNNKWWARDEFFSAVVNKPIVENIVKEGLQEKVMAEKAEATAIWKQIECISNEMSLPDSLLLEAIQVSCSYGRIKYELIEQMWVLMIANEQAIQSGKRDNTVIIKALNRYDSLWKEWKNLKASSSQCGTIYTEFAFRNERAGSIGEFVDTLREKVGHKKE